MVKKKLINLKYTDYIKRNQFVIPAEYCQKCQKCIVESLEMNKKKLQWLGFTLLLEIEQQ